MQLLGWWNPASAGGYRGAFANAIRTGLEDQEPRSEACRTRRKGPWRLPGMDGSMVAVWGYLQGYDGLKGINCKRDDCQGIPAVPLRIAVTLSVRQLE